MNNVVLAKLRNQAVNRFLTETCVIERSTQSTDALMDQVDHWSVIEFAAKCRMITVGAGMGGDNLEMIGERDAMLDEYRLALAVGTDILADDRVHCQGKAYEVVNLETDLTDRFFIHAILRLRRGVELGD